MLGLSSRARNYALGVPSAPDPIDPTSLIGRTIIVTGGSRGIGAGIARHLAGRGARLVLTARRSEALDTIARELTASGADVITAQLDVADRDGALHLAERAITEFGSIDGLVLNAQSFRPVTPLLDVAPADLELLMQTGPAAVLWHM